MIKFFRHIRKSLLMENKTSRYFKYAIGEIILVVIGILIALQVNNWNNDREKDNKTKAIFGQIIDELVIDVQVIKDANQYYIFKDSMIQAYRDIDVKMIPRESDTIIDDYDLLEMIRTYAPMEIHDRGFNLLMNQADQMDKEYESYINDLVYIYQDLKPSLDLYNQRLLDLLKEHRLHKIENHAWYSRMHLSGKNKYDPEFNYHKHDPIYKNYVEYYNEMIWNIFVNARSFEDLAIKLSRKVNKDFNINKDIDDKLSFYKAPKGVISSIAGKYLFEKDTLTFLIKENQLYESTYDNKDITYVFEKDYKVGFLRYLNDSTFFRNIRHNLRVNADGTLSIIPLNNRVPIPLKRIKDD